ncbi:hypothetical protein K458DRAFT_427670 [Lentithecium fluviatile CBS 122367]|uniref:RCC1/BLIP-II n=1 Tax=Lentithecium fluviatile CBS 122367 TaxID=1168545 RepID=A0A6G1JG39_9PLEO|nr:hypothetical protein K458DRAFT_427670 [Lentithecium fluviatile CBS 122367]
MEFYAFGRDVRKHGKIDELTPKLVVEAPWMRILWASWCDLVYAYVKHGDFKLEYLGTSLRPQQATHVRKTGLEPMMRFFGHQMSHGLMGIISPRAQLITFFHPEKAIWDGKKPIERHSYKSEAWDILNTQFMGGDGVLISNSLAGGFAVDMPSVDRFEDSDLNGHVPLPLHHRERLGFAPSEWCTNATTFTALDENGKVYTYATDRRYPKCLGRPFETQIGTHLGDRAAPIPYFSETRIERIASGGYYTAAITDDGELYIWGQACPTPNFPNEPPELDVLQRSANEDEDEFVHCVNLEVHGREAIAKDVAIGHGHVLVVVEVKGDVPNEIFCTVLGAGQNDRGQLGREDRYFSKDFVEIEKFRGEDIKQVICVGYSSFVVVARHSDFVGGRLGRTASI